MLRTFNCGVGMVLYVDADHLEAVSACLRRAGEDPLVLGRVVPRAGKDAPRVRVSGGAWMNGAVEVE